MRAEVEEKFNRLRNLVKDKRILVAFSGGVDSTALAYFCKKHARETVLLTVDSITFPRSELRFAQKIADELGIPLEVVQVNELENPDLVKNPIDRCYHCKKELATVWLEQAKKLGLDMVVDGTNATDVKGHRPGAKALEEAGVVSPFKIVGITKEEIREFARENGLSVADRPPMACLSSRFPYGTAITEKRIRMVDAVEQAVKEIFGVECVRARYHGDIVRIEVGRDERTKMFDVVRLDKLNEIARSIGFRYVTLDIQGYRTGAMDEVLESSTALSSRNT